MKQQQRFFLSLFLFGTLIAAAGWLVDLSIIRGIVPLLTHGSLLAGTGHLMQVVAAFGSLVTPDANNRDERWE